jgi:hypothetical protein
VIERETAIRRAPRDMQRGTVSDRERNSDKDSAKRYAERDSQ